MEEASLAAPGGPTESSDEGGLRCCGSRGHEPGTARKPEMHARNASPGVGNAPDVQGTASDVVEGEGIPATADLQGQDRGNDAGSTVDLNDHPVLQLGIPGACNYP